jgi:hypothetical protein
VRIRRFDAARIPTFEAQIPVHPVGCSIVDLVGVTPWLNIAHVTQHPSRVLFADLDQNSIANLGQIPIIYAVIHFSSTNCDSPLTFCISPSFYRDR